ncbi:MAG TPA: hypothetical protein VF601_18305 [Beijerinckiaceae bacterium]
MSDESAEEYRRHAAECRAKADAASGPFRVDWLILAELWDTHASMIDRSENPGDSLPPPAPAKGKAQTEAEAVGSATPAPAESEARREDAAVRSDAPAAEGKAQTGTEAVGSATPAPAGSEAQREDVAVRNEPPVVGRETQTRTEAARSATSAAVEAQRKDAAARSDVPAADAVRAESRGSRLPAKLTAVAAIVLLALLLSPAWEGDRGTPRPVGDPPPGRVEKAEPAAPAVNPPSSPVAIPSSEKAQPAAPARVDPSRPQSPSAGPSPGRLEKAEPAAPARVDPSRPPSPTAGPSPGRVEKAEPAAPASDPSRPPSPAAGPSPGRVEKAEPATPAGDPSRPPSSTAGPSPGRVEKAEPAAPASDPSRPPVPAAGLDPPVRPPALGRRATREVPGDAVRSSGDGVPSTGAAPRRPAVEAPLPGKLAARPHSDPGSERKPAPRPDALVGTWWPNACPAPDRRDRAVPLVLDAHGSRAGKASCVFDRKTARAGSWDVAMRCTKDGASWTSSVRLKLAGDRLTATSEGKTHVFARCARPPRVGGHREAGATVEP